MDEIEKTLQIALKRELDSVKLYTFLASLYDLQEYQQSITQILEFEHQHVLTIKELLNTHNFDNFGIMSRNISHIPNVEAPKDFNEVKDDPKKLIAFAIKKEEKSFEFYGKLFAYYETHIVLADIVKRLMIEEEDHKLELERIYRKLR